MTRARATTPGRDPDPTPRRFCCVHDPRGSDGPVLDQGPSRSRTLTPPMGAVAFTRRPAGLGPPGPARHRRGGGAAVRLEHHARRAGAVLLGRGQEHVGELEGVLLRRVRPQGHDHHRQAGRVVPAAGAVRADLRLLRLVARAAAGHRGRHLRPGHVPGRAPLGRGGAGAARGRDLHADADRGVDVRPQHGGRRAHHVPGAGRRRLPARGDGGAAAVAASGPASGSAWASRPRCCRRGWCCPRSPSATWWRRRPGSRRRLWQLGVAGVVMLAVSLSWIALYTFTPASDRPYVDGSTDNSAIAMVFGYNGLERFGISVRPGTAVRAWRRWGPPAVTSGGRAARVGRAGGTLRRPGRPSGALRRQRWAARRRHGRWAPLRRAPASWRSGFGSGWTKLLGSELRPGDRLALPAGRAGADLRAAAGRAGPSAATRCGPGSSCGASGCSRSGLIFSKMSAIPHTAYVASLAPPLAALSAAGIVMFWRTYRAGGWRGWVLPVAVAAELAWTLFLWRDYGGFLPWARDVIVVAGVDRDRGAGRGPAVPAGPGPAGDRRAGRRRRRHARGARRLGGLRPRHQVRRQLVQRQRRPGRAAGGSAAAAADGRIGRPRPPSATATATAGGPGRIRRPARRDRTDRATGGARRRRGGGAGGGITGSATTTLTSAEQADLQLRRARIATVPAT